jgi:hypothetical protein
MIPIRVAHLALVAGAMLATFHPVPSLAQRLPAAESPVPREQPETMRPQPCSVEALRGHYGFSVRGFTDAASGLPAPLQGPFAAAGTTVYDGAGHVTIAARSASFNGVVRTVPPENGTYAVDGDCVVTAQYPSGVTTRNVLVDGGRAMYAMQTNAGTTIAGVSQRLGRSDDLDRERLRCTPQGLAGRYGFIAEGHAGPPTLALPASVPLVGNGRVTLQASGRFDATALRSVGGMLDAQPLALSGSFSVGADCAVQMSFDVGFNFSGTVVDGGREIVFVETDPGTALVVRARRQH